MATGRDKLSTLEQRVKWLLKHTRFLVDGTTPLRVTLLREIVVAMKDDGLIAHTTYWKDCRSGVEAAREQAKERWHAKR